MVSGQISTALVVPASQPAVILPTRLGAANGTHDNGATLPSPQTALGLINEAIGIRGGDRTDMLDAPAAFGLECKVTMLMIISGMILRREFNGYGAEYDNDCIELSKV